MPAGYKWNPNLHRWVKKDTQQKIDYEQQDSESWALLLSYWRWYPDAMLDVLESDEADFTLALIQRMNLRIFARYQEAYITGSRGTTKTYIAESSKLSDGILWPGEQMRYFGPALNQTAELASATYKQITKNYPLLTQHYKVISDAKEHFEVETDYHSNFTIKTMRGDNSHAVLAEEVGQEEMPFFDHQKFRAVVLPACRLKHMVCKLPDPLHIDFKKQYITSACRQQNEAYQYRCDIIKGMISGESCFAIDYPWTVAVLSGIRDLAWAETLRKKLTPEEWMREMESIYTGVSENPVIRDSVLTESKKLQVMETHHCQDPNAIYIIGYDVSYEDGAKNAKCATAVVKCTPQEKLIKRDKYLKQLVYVEDQSPKEAMLQAVYLKELFQRYSMEGGSGTYISIDAQAYGTAVVEWLMKDLNDGLPTLCCFDHEHIELELPGALPVIYPIKATPGAGGVHDPDSEMLRYAEIEFEHGNVHILTTNITDGVEAYKRAHRIKDGTDDAKFAIPYQKCKELCGQISNLKRKFVSGNWSEIRISKLIQRDMWSAFKYALRLTQILEHKNLLDSIRRPSDWDDVKKQFEQQGRIQRGQCFKPRVITGRRGRIF